MVNEGGQQENQHQNQNGGDDNHHLGGSTANIHGVVQNIDGGVGHGLTAGDIGSGVLQQVADTDGGNHNGHSGGAAQGLVGCPLNEEAQCDGHGNDDGNRHIHGQCGRDIDTQKSRDHEYIAVGEVNQAQDTVNHGIADGDQRQLSAKGNAAQKNGYNVFYG